MSLKEVERVKKRDKARWLMEFPGWAVAAVERGRDGCGSPGHEVGMARVLLPVCSKVMHLMHLHLGWPVFVQASRPLCICGLALSQFSVQLKLADFMSLITTTT